MAASAVCFLRNPVLLQLLIEVAARRADHFGRLRDVPAVLAQLADQERPFGRLLELAQRAGILLIIGAGRPGFKPDHVAQIVTFSTIKARAAVRDAARVLGYPYVVGDKIAKLMPPLIMGRDTPLAACLVETPKHEGGYKMASELRELYAADPDAKRVIDVARGLEGLRRQDGIHAAAVVITRDPLTEYLPVQRKPEPGGDLASAPIVTQYEMHGVEDLGLLKMDFLGLRNLDVISDTVEIVKETRGVDLDIDRVAVDEGDGDILPSSARRDGEGDGARAGAAY